MSFSNSGFCPLRKEALVSIVSRMPSFRLEIQTGGISKLHMYQTCLNNEDGRLGKKSLTLLSMWLPGNDNVFVHFSISESLACKAKTETQFWGFHGYLCVEVLLWVSTPQGDQCQPTITGCVQQMHGKTNTHTHNCTNWGAASVHVKDDKTTDLFPSRP